jgi:hypothetical protein
VPNKIGVASVIFYGETIRGIGFKPDREPVAQVKAEAK